MLFVERRDKDVHLLALGDEMEHKIQQKSANYPDANAAGNAAAGSLSLFSLLSLSSPSSFFSSSLLPTQKTPPNSKTAPRAAAATSAADVSLDVTKMAPLGDRLLVRPRPAEEKSAGGVILSAGISGGATLPQQDALVGTVVAVGEEVALEGVSVGDSVLFSKYSSSDVSLPDGGEVCFVAEKSVLAKLS